MGGTRAPAGYPYNAGAPDNHSARTSTYHTPVPSARSSDYVSAYEGSSACATARTVDNGILLEEEPTRHETPKAGTNQRRQKAIAAAMDAFVPTDSRGTPAESGGATSQRSAPSLDPRKVLSAARHGRHKEVEASLVAGFDPTHQDPFGNTLFHVACQNGNKRIAKLAIKYGGDMDAQNERGNTGLHFLYAYGYPEVAEYFIEKGADGHMKNELGKEPHEGIR